MNKTLLKVETMECTYPDAIMDEVNQNIIFRTMQEFSSAENLVAKRIYVINDLIEVVKCDEIPQYTSIDKPCYQVKIQEAKRKGFLKLKQVENNAPIIKAKEYVENYEPLPGPSTRCDSEYEYSMITEMRTPKPLEIVNEVERRDTLPETCFTQKNEKCFPIESLDSEDDEEVRQEFFRNLTDEDFMKKVIYVNSHGFMKYFQNGLFPTSLGKSLGFSEDAIATAKAIPGKIFLQEFDIESNVNKPFQIIPAVTIPWPDEQTIEFVYRDERNTIINTRTGATYQWPTTGHNGMIEEMRNMTAVLVPKGYTKKKGVNKDAYLEWEINFPKAERYLEARMSHAQMKCLLILLTLHKTYIDPVTKQNGLLPEHLRTFMYWQCEKDFRNWPEHRLGTKLLRVIKDLQQNLFFGVLPNYFIKEQNLFENIPKKYLNYAQKVFLDILGNPVPYFIKALSYLRYASGKFYPPVNLKELYEVLRTKSSPALLNPQLAYSIVTQRKRRIYKNPESQIKHLKYLKKKEQILRERHLQKSKQNENEDNDYQMKNDINVNDPIDNELDTIKTITILEIFIKHFIEIGKKSSNLATYDQAMFYFKQAMYLNKILEETSSMILEAHDYQQIIAKEESRIRRKTIRSVSSSEEPPPTPIRKSITFNDINQQLKSGSIRLKNLENSFNNGIQNASAQKINLGKPVRKKTVVFAESDHSQM
ncbi:hypothetical protein ABEB36_009076 [Hypothenemus hampei]